MVPFSLAHWRQWVFLGVVGIALAVVGYWLLNFLLSLVLFVAVAAGGLWLIGKVGRWSGRGR